jgi:hypothetical protein
MELERLYRCSWYHRWVESRASLIRDPVRRLSYLRRAMPVLPRRRGGVHAMLLMAAAFGLVMIAIPGQNTGSGWFLDREVAAPYRETRVAPEAAVWIVESRGTYEVYSNGLRIETDGVVENELRVSNVLQAGRLSVIAGQSAPAGIVYHTTESHIAPFEATNNLRLQRVGRWLRDFVAQNRSYHYLIDRFGRVHRVVRESDAAYHAGASVWGIQQTVWVNLNHSFLGVAFESQTTAGDKLAESVTPAQIRAAATLTSMLRSRYNLPPDNCVTHAQVSVNPANMGIGLHTDWGANFPFAEVGLPDNYAQPLAAIHQFGFVADESYRNATGPRLARGIEAAEATLSSQATALNLATDVHRQALQQRYRKIMSALPKQLAAAAQESKENRP